MAVRIKSHWHNEDQQRSHNDVGSALAFNGWKIEMDKAINLHGEDFDYSDDQQRLDVISEYLIFETQIVDRMAHEMVDDETRAGVVRALVIKLSEYIADNGQELLGPGEHGQRFIDRFNQRSQEYAEFEFSMDGPSYPFYRHLGSEIQQLMGSQGENRWVIDQVMDVDGPQVFKQLRRITFDLLDD